MRAIGSRSTRKMHVRVAADGDDIYIDLADADWHAVRVTAAGWSIVLKPAGVFRAQRRSQPSPFPARACRLTDCGLEARRQGCPDDQGRGRALTLEASRQTAAERDDISYAKKEGWLLAHNLVRPEAADTPHGWQGFRRFWISPEFQKEHDWPICNCGWRPDLGPHYSVLAEKAE